MRDMKDSGIEWYGNIPREWRIAPIKRQFAIVAGATPKSDKSEYWDGGIPWITPADYKTVDKYVSSGRKTISNTGYRSCGTTMIPANSIIFSKRAPVGTVCININELCTNQGCLSCVPKDRVSVIYYYYLMSILTEQFELVSAGTTFKEISADTFANFALTVPSIDEQERIAGFLDKECSQIDALISRTRESIAEYKKLKQAVISQSVTKGIRGDRTLVSSGLTWVPELPENWQKIPSKFLFRNSDLRKQPEDEQLTASQKYGIISQREYMERENSKIVLANKGIDDWKHVEPYDFVISLRSFQGGLEMSETTGCITWHYIVLKPCKPIVSKYYKWLFKSEVYIKALQRTCNFIRDGQDLRYSNFVQVPLFEPPLAEQQEIADYLDRKCAEIDRLIAQKEQFLAEIENYKKTLIYEYVTGKKEVPAERTAPVVTFIDARALLVCRIVELMKPKGRIHLQKAMHMVDCLLGLNNETQYSRHKHGPYDVRIQEYEQAAEQKGWIKVNQGSSVEYSAGAKLEEYRDAYLSLYGDVDAEIQRICAFLAPMKTSQSERVATLLAAWNDFLLEGVPPTDQQLIQEVRTNWTPNKANSPEETWLDTLNKIRKNGFVPAGKGLCTVTAG